MAKASRKVAVNRNILSNDGSGTLSIRFDPKLRYALELGARVEHRNLSNLMEAAIREYLTKVKLHSYINNEDTISNCIEKLWDVDLPDRLCKLGMIAPHLLNHDEQKIWKWINERSIYWIEQNIDFQRVRIEWESIVSIACQK